MAKRINFRCCCYFNFNNWQLASLLLRQSAIDDVFTFCSMIDDDGGGIDTGRVGWSTLEEKASMRDKKEVLGLVNSIWFLNLFKCVCVDADASSHIWDAAAKQSIFACLTQTRRVLTGAGYGAAARIFIPWLKMVARALILSWSVVFSFICPSTFKPFFLTPSHPTSRPLLQFRWLVFPLVIHRWSWVFSVSPINLFKLIVLNESYTSRVPQGPRDTFKQLSVDVLFSDPIWNFNKVGI